jgi:hypothetical protein
MATKPIIAARRPDANSRRWVAPAGCDWRGQSAIRPAGVGIAVRDWRRGSACILAVGELVVDLAAKGIDVWNAKSTALGLRFPNSAPKHTHHFVEFLMCLVAVK